MIYVKHANHLLVSTSLRSVAWSMPRSLSVSVSPLSVSISLGYSLSLCICLVLSVCLCLYLSLVFSLSLSVSVLSVWLCLCLSRFLSLCLSCLVCLSVSLSPTHTFTHVITHVYVRVMGMPCPWWFDIAEISTYEYNTIYVCQWGNQACQWIRIYTQRHPLRDAISCGQSVLNNSPCSAMQLFAN